MSIDHYSSDLPEPLCRWTQQSQIMTTQSPPNHHHNRHPFTSSTVLLRKPTFNFNLNQDEDEDDDDVEQGVFSPQQKEPMFEKPLTPSDVGKLNRLVIPKQHAEKYFPLGGGGGDSSEKGLLLSFEDESGKSWRFRYSYWNSSQSYVLTKGWSRFVKDKRLDAGDVVLFERHRLDGDRLFIGWRRRGAPAAVPMMMQDGGGMVVGHHPPPGIGNGGGGGWSRVFYDAPQSYPSHLPANLSPYQPDCLHADAAAGSAVHNNNINTSDNQKAASGGNPRRLVRLFGVNLECQSQPDESELPTPDGSSISSQQAQPHYHPYEYSSPNHHMQMDTNFSRDVNQMMRYQYHQG